MLPTEVDYECDSGTAAHIKRRSCNVTIALTWALICLVALACSPRATEEASPTKQTHSPARVRSPTGPPSVLLVTLDTTRRDRLGLYGAAKNLTPALDRLARKGTVFWDARTETPITLPSHTTIHTGKSILQHGVRENGSFKVSPDALTLAEELSSKGYETAAFVSSFVLSQQFGLSQGFETFDDAMTTGRRAGWHGHDVDKFERSANETADRTVQWLDARRADKPYFLWAHFYDPHGPYQRRASFLAKNRSDYETEVAFMDAHFDRVVRAARRADDDLLVVVCSDHGENLGEHGIVGHGQDLYEPAMKAVWIMQHSTRVPSGKKVTARVALSQVAATIAETLGLELRFPSNSAVSLIKAQAPSKPTAYYMETIVPSFRFNRSAVHALIDGHHKLIHWPGDKRTALFNLNKDPHETVDLAARKPDIASEMLRRLQERMTPASSDIAAPVEMSEDTIDKLKALGYMQ